MSADVQLAAQPHGFTAMQYAICLKGIVWREALRFRAGTFCTTTSKRA